MIEYALALLAGVLVKATDWIEDELGGKRRVKWLFAIIYGLLIGYVIGNASFSTLFLAALFAQVVAGKIDRESHILAFFIAIAVVLVGGVKEVKMVDFFLFLVLAYVDEIETLNRFSKLMDYRPFLKLGALAFVLVGRYDYLFGILAFDIGYILSEKGAANILK